MSANIDAASPHTRRRPWIAAVATAAVALIPIVGFAQEGPQLRPDAHSAPQSQRNGLTPSVTGAVEPPDTAGPSYFVPIPAYRAFDSRHAGVKWQEGQLSKVDVRLDEWNDQVFTIPADATAVSFNVTVAATEVWGFVQIFGPGVDGCSTSTVNWWQGGMAIANSGSTMLFVDVVGDWNVWWPEPELSLGVCVGGQPGAKAHVIIDVTGYYAPLADLATS